MTPRWIVLFPEYLIFLTVFKVSGDFCGEQDFNISQNALFSLGFLDILWFFAGLPGPARIPDLARSGAPVFFPAQAGLSQAWPGLKAGTRFFHAQCVFHRNLN